VLRVSIKFKSGGVGPESRAPPRRGFSLRFRRQSRPSTQTPPHSIPLSARASRARMHLARAARARVSSDTSPTIRVGNRIRLVPFHQFSGGNKYQIDPVWSASLGAIYFSDSYASSDDSVYLPGFLRFDAGVYAQIDATWKAQLNIENIFNKGYWASADANNNISPGQPRTFRFKVTAKL